MKLTYIYHSGFAVETEQCAVVIDFWQDPAGVIGPLLAGGKPLYVLASHFHEDHFNPAVLDWGRGRGGVTYVLSKDIMRRRRAPKDAAHWLAKGGSYADGNISVGATGSTDSGVSFVIDVGGCRLFHAGDLNNWQPSQPGAGVGDNRAEAMYLGELKDVCKVADRVDVAFFPVDARIGSGYMRGPRQFLERVHTSLFVPMHFTASGAGSAAAFELEASPLCGRFWLPSCPGQSISV